MAEQLQKAGGIPVGAGGDGAKEGKDPVLRGEMSEKIGKMAQEGSEQVRRGDGTVLEERGETPRNPKKKTFEADVEDAKHQQQQQQRSRGQDQDVKEKDEL